MSGENRLDGADKTRLCPTCRSPISVLATKCRFCGEAVGRPKDEARKLTVDDLGGESSSDFNRSEDVMEALEAYRREEYMPQAAKEEGAGWLRRKRRGKGPAGKPDTRAGRPGAARSTGHDKAGPPKSIWSSNLGIAVAAFAAIVLLIIVAGLVVSQVNSRSGSIETQTSENFRNPAIAILAAGGPGAEALRAAHEALRRANTPDNQQIANQARALVEKEVLALVKRAEGAGITEKQVLGFAKENLAQYRCPKYVRFVDELPKTATGKVRKNVLAEQFKDLARR